MTRPKNQAKSIKVAITAHPAIGRSLAAISRKGLWGSTPGEVAKYLIQEGILDMISKGVIVAADEETESEE